MDADFWTTRLAAAKRQFNLQHHHHLGHATTTTGHQTSQLDRFNMDDLEVEEETRPDLPCPYCYEEFDIASLCSHLEDEHSYESNPTVCPVCSVKVSRDMLSHITLQHGHLFKLRRRRRLRRFAVPNTQALSLLGRDLREAHLQALLGGTGSGYRSSSATTSNVAADPFLSSLALNFSTSETDDITKSLISSIEDSSKSKASDNMWKSSFDASLSYEEREERIKQVAGRARFVQDLLYSSLLTEQ